MTDVTLTREEIEKLANALGYEVTSRPNGGNVPTEYLAPDLQDARAVRDRGKPEDPPPAPQARKPDDPAPALQAWKGPLVVENAPTGDRRRVMPGALSVRDLPLPLMFQRETPPGGLGGNPHAGARAAGHIDLVWPGENGEAWGAGVFDSGEDGQEAARMIREKTIQGLSVDLDDVDATVVEVDDHEELQITKARIMGVTVVPFPAIPGAGISLIDSEEFASL